MSPEVLEPIFDKLDEAHKLVKDMPNIDLGMGPDVDVLFEWIHNELKDAADLINDSPSPHTPHPQALVPIHEKLQRAFSLIEDLIIQLNVADVVLIPDELKDVQHTILDMTPAILSPLEMKLEQVRHLCDWWWLHCDNYTTGANDRVEWILQRLVATMQYDCAITICSGTGCIPDQRWQIPSQTCCTNSCSFTPARRLLRQ